MAKYEKIWAIIVKVNTDDNGNITSVTLRDNLREEIDITYDVLNKAIELDRLTVLNYIPSDKKMTDNWNDIAYYEKMLDQKVAISLMSKNNRHKKSNSSVTEGGKVEHVDAEEPQEQKTVDRAIISEQSLSEIAMQVADMDELYFVGNTNPSSFKANLTKQGYEVETVSRTELNIPGVHAYRILKETTEDYYKYALYIVSKHIIEFEELEEAFIQFNVSGISFSGCKASTSSMHGTFKNMSLNFLDISGLDITSVNNTNKTFYNLSGIESANDSNTEVTLVTLGVNNNFLRDNGSFDKAIVKFI